MNKQEKLRLQIKIETILKDYALNSTRIETTEMTAQRIINICKEASK